MMAENGQMFRLSFCITGREDLLRADRLSLYKAFAMKLYGICVSKEGAHEQTMPKEQKKKQTEPGEHRTKGTRKLAREILEYTRDQLIVQMPYFNRAIVRMPVVFYENGFNKEDVPQGFGTNGKRIFCNPDKVLGYFRDDSARLPRMYLHMLLHCVFSHPFQYERLNSNLWDFASDIAVENVILEMHWKDVAQADDIKRIRFIQGLKRKAGKITAENLYHYFCGHQHEAAILIRQSKLFHQDLHYFWGASAHYEEEGGISDVNRRFDKTSADWGEIGKNVRQDMESFEKNQGDIPDILAENIRDVRKDRYNYEEFLRKFTQNREEMHINHDEFDYIYYSYGMELYGNMPLIEPLEYRDVRKIRDFVIAIDTSGSTQGTLVRGFLDKTYSILRSSGSFFENRNVHIIQCDCKVQQDVTVHSGTEFEKYIQNMEIKGGGGTDFRPVFRHTDELIRTGEIQDLRGLLYFTDGMGNFPERMPQYKTAFLFLRDGKRKIPKVPAWAMKLELDIDDVRQRDFTAETF